MIPAMHLRILLLLRNNTKYTLSALSQEMDVSRPQLSVALSTLYERGFLIRTTDDKDRRRVYLSLSQEGIDFLDNMQKTVVSHLAGRLSTLSEEEQLRVLEAVTTLRELLKKV